MPYIEGETLRDKLNRETQLGIDEAVKITIEVADALDYAHRNKIIHRDIKPENILLHDGRPMVADFGIALAVSAAAGARMTETGLSLGTPHYMSPEQATAERDLTHRSDIYSLGAVLYEMLTGDPPHTGSSAQQIIMKILTEQATPVIKARKSVPPNVAAAVSKALERLPADRFDRARAFAEALTNSAFALTTVSEASEAPKRTASAVTAAALAALSIVLGALALWGWLRRARPQPVARYAVELPAAHPISDSWAPLAVSPDGARLVYLGESDRGPLLFLRSRDQLDPVEIPETEGAFNPFFSPDGERLGFMADPGGIKVVSLAGAPPVTVTDEEVGAPGATWAPDGYIYYDAAGDGPLRRVPSAGGASESVGTLDSATGERQHLWPDALPSGRGILMIVRHGGPGQGATDTDDVAVLDLATGEHRILTRGVYARYAVSGHLLYVTADGVLMGVSFDQDRMALTGSPVALAQGIALRPPAGGVGLTVSTTGTLWYTTGRATGPLGGVVWMSRDGTASEVDPDWTGDFLGIALSPDGTRLAVSERQTVGQHIWIKQLDRGPVSRLTFEGSNAEPAWDPNGRSVTFVSMRTGRSRLFRAPADGSAPSEAMLDDRLWIVRAGWSPDGQWLICDVVVEGEWDVYGLRPAVDTRMVPLVVTGATEGDASVSPDGRWLLYRSDRTGRSEVYVRPFPNTTESLRQISSDGGSQPVWAHSGRELFYRNGNNEMVAAEVRSGESFAIGEQRVLFSMAEFDRWDLSPDDQRFVMTTRGENHPGALIVVENFFEELKARVGR